MYIDNIMCSIHTRYYTIETLIQHLVIKYCIYFEISKIRLQHQQLLLFRELTVFTLRRVSHKSHVWKQRLGFSKASSFQNIVDGIVKGTPGLKVKDDRLITLFGETAGSMIHLWRLNLYDSFDKIFWEHIITFIGFYWFWNCVCVIYSTTTWFPIGFLPSENVILSPWTIFPTAGGCRSSFPGEYSSHVGEIQHSGECRKAKFIINLKSFRTDKSRMNWSQRQAVIQREGNLSKIIKSINPCCVFSSYQ